MLFSFLSSFFPHAPNICFCLQNGELDFSLRTRLQLHRKKVVVQLTGASVSLLCVINRNRYKLIRNKYVACTENCTLCSPRILKSGKGWGSGGKYTWSPSRIGKWLYKFFKGVKRGVKVAVDMFTRLYKGRYVESCLLFRYYSVFTWDLIKRLVK